MSTPTETETPSETETEGGTRLSYETRDRLYHLALYGSAALFSAVILFPIYWMVQNAFTDSQTVITEFSWLPSPETVTLDNFSVLAAGAVPRYVINTIVVTAGTIVVVVGVSLVAGYGMARFRFRYKESFAQFLLLGYMFSPIVLGLPLYLIWSEIGLLNAQIGLVIALSSISMPFAVWLMWKYIQTIPESMEESAWIAGASRWRTFWDVVVPQTKPAIVACALFAFAIAWNDFTFAQILLPSQESTTFAPGIMRLIDQGGYTSWGDIMAVSLLMTVPPLLFAYFLQEYLLKGFEVRTR
ncbi:carbohydrate ABC transporter permease [Natrialba taiwanensis]|uniref:Binding-protein-dependent transporters inner membrane component n=1 Tax=Natrialba taiwanensis DSM 12281 TaxID=1230458 RepID=L9ZUI6_9EURY|nr:carbohydrate ABC transporter permease [Natrialba taiwanensis]ELY88828.1 binding-protein-dependent transporters inner membrane component [Natrialba taiwanensis DSM 12281]